MTDPTREAFPVDAETINLALDAWFDGDCSRPHYEEHIDQMRAAASVIVAALSARAQGEAVAYMVRAASGGVLCYPVSRERGVPEPRDGETVTPLYAAAPKQQAMEVGEPGAVDVLVRAANATLAANPHDDTMWTLEAAVAPFNATKPAECENGCPPQQVCDYCQIAARYTATPKQQAMGVAEAWAIIEEMCVITEAVTPDPTDVRATLNRLIDYHVSVNNDLKQQAVTDEDVRWCRDIAGDLREAGGPTNAMRLVALERLIRAALAGKTEVGRG